ncbi:hypothetical protein FocTR4_00005773 [Fusarium oxysporum f. sp. cubense]|uniref:Uncharacterized protein n=1 Tax=Fusarium oxysporum f. sp. cubense TaxID=61366 RepID=A0A5C6TGK1_FUSOC|nr:hypothetical protein FocTR4_00005773 [Fusarium oxysporum f. sp. cubense]
MGLVESSEEDEPFQLGGPTSSGSASSAVEESPDKKKIEYRPGLEPAKLYRGVRSGRLPRSLVFALRDSTSSLPPRG